MQNIKVVLNGQGIDEIFGGTDSKFITRGARKK